MKIKNSFIIRKYCKNPCDFQFNTGELDSIETAVQIINETDNFFDDFKSDFKELIGRVNNSAKSNSRRKRNSQRINNTTFQSQDQQLHSNEERDKKKNDNKDEVVKKLQSKITEIIKNSTNDQSSHPFCDINNYKVSVELNVETLNYEAIMTCPDCLKELVVTKVKGKY